MRRLINILAETLGHRLVRCGNAADKYPKGVFIGKRKKLIVVVDN